MRTKPRRFADGGENRFRPELHFRPKLLFDQFVAQPVGQPLTRLRSADVVRLGRRERVAEMRGDGREKSFPARLWRIRQPKGAAQITGRNFRIRFVEQKTGSIEKLHQAAGLRKAAFWKQNKFAAALQIFRHAFDGVRRVGVHGKGVAIDHDEAVQPTYFCRGTGGDETPVVIQANREKKPVQPGGVIRREQHRPRRAQGCFVERAEAEKNFQQSAEESFHKVL